MLTRFALYTTCLLCHWLFLYSYSLLAFSFSDIHCTIFGNFASLNFCNFWVYLGLIAKNLPPKILKVFPCHTFFWIIRKIIFTKSLKFLFLRKCKIFAVYGPLSARENNSIHWGLDSLYLYTLPPPSERRVPLIMDTLIRTKYIITYMYNVCTQLIKWACMDSHFFLTPLPPVSRFLGWLRLLLLPAEACKQSPL